MGFSEFEDLSAVDKYVMPDAVYDAMPDTYRKFKARQLAKDPNWKEFAGQLDIDHQKADADLISVDSRCEAIGAKRGVVMYVGLVPGLGRGYWVGVKFDEPVGDNNG